MECLSLAVRDRRFLFLVCLIVRIFAANLKKGELVMFIVFGVMLTGILVGYLMRFVPNITFIGKIITLFIFLLLFSLGISVGKNEVILNNLSTIGLQALIITIGAVGGSICLTSIIYNKYFKKEEDKQ